MKSIHVRRLESRVERTARRFVELAARDRLSVADLSAVKLPWYAVRNAAGDAESDTATVFIFDEIGGSFGVSAKQFAEDLEAITAPTIKVRINSPGGSVFDGIAIYNALRHHRSRVVVYVDSLAASAASVIATAGDEVVMMPGSQMMIHDASALEDGNAEDMAKMSTFLDRQSDNIADLYRLKAGGDVAEWRDLMKAETWLFAREAVEAALADRVEEPEPAPDLDDELAALMQRSHDLSQWQYRYAGRREAPAPPMRRVARVVGPSERSSGGAAVAHRPSSDRERGEAARLRGAAGRPAQTMRAAPAGAGRAIPFPAALRAALEDRGGQQLYHLTGQASVFDTPYEMWDEFGPYLEIVDRHAADETLAAKPDVAFLVNHRGVTMARTTNRSLELAASTGIDVDAWLNPKRQDVSDLVVAIEDRNITEMSFAFMLQDGRWAQDFSAYRILRLDLDRGDVSAVNYGANPYTSVATRSREILADLDHLPAGAARAALDRLQHRGDLTPVTAQAPISAAAIDEPAGGRTTTDVDAWLATVAAGK